MSINITAETLASWRGQRARLVESVTARKHSADQAFRHEVCRALQVGTNASNERLLAALDAAVAATTPKGSAPMGTKLTINAEVRRKLGLTENATSEQVMTALATALAKPTRRERRAAADRAGSTTEDALWDEIYPSAPTRNTDPTEGLSADDAAAYREVWPDDDTASASSPDDALYGEVWPEG